MATTTMNGYSLVSVPLTTITAGGRSTQVRAGAVAVVLAHVARRFHAEVEPLVTFHGWRSVLTNVIVGGHPRSNHPSGTAFDANGYRHPYRAPVNFTAAQVRAIRRILAEVAPVVRWGGDFGAALRDGMHFEIVGTTAQVAAVAARLTTHPAALTPEDDMPYTPDQLIAFSKQGLSEALLEVATGDTPYGRKTADNLTASARVTAHRILTAMAGRSDPTARQMADLLRTVVVAPTPAAVVQAIPDEYVQAVLDGLAARLTA